MTAAEMSRLRARMYEQIRHWQEETERARASVARISEQSAAWAAGCQQGREDVLSLTRTLAQHITQGGEASTIVAAGHQIRAGFLLSP
jgi:hypothetical protein